MSQEARSIAIDRSSTQNLLDDHLNLYRVGTL
jgi:hypothetical protein